jgi:hypothetical protein
MTPARVVDPAIVLVVVEEAATRIDATPVVERHDLVGMTTQESGGSKVGMGTHEETVAEPVEKSVLERTFCVQAQGAPDRMASVKNRLDQDQTNSNDFDGVMYLICP